MFKVTNRYALRPYVNGFRTFGLLADRRNWNIFCPVRSISDLLSSPLLPCRKRIISWWATLSLSWCRPFNFMSPMTISRQSPWDIYMISCVTLFPAETSIAKYNRGTFVVHTLLKFQRSWTQCFVSPYFRRVCSSVKAVKEPNAF